MAKSFLNQPGLPLGLRNNNPGNLRPGDNWQGMVGTNGGFIQFENIGWGVRALGIDLTTKIRNGYNTIELIIFRYAPPSENDTLAYIASVVADTGIQQNKTLAADTITLKKIIRAIMNVELGKSFSAMVTDADVLEGLGMINDNTVGVVGFSVASFLFLLSLYLLYTMPKRDIT